MKLRAPWQVAVFSLLAFCVLVTTARANDVKTGPRPGENNPSNPAHPALFRDDELLILGGYSDDHKIKYHYLWPASDALTVWGAQHSEHQFLSSEFSSTSRFRHFAAASGRILNPDKCDTAAYAFFRPDGKVELELWDAQSGRKAATVLLDGTQVPDRSLDVGVGDLDRAVDDSGMLHDEIVLVRTSGAEGKEVAIDVLDYNLNILGSSRFSWPDGAGLLAAGIGDLNGDRYPELAVGIASHTRLVRQVSIFRFARDNNKDLIFPLQFVKVTDNYFPQSPGFGCWDCGNRSFDMAVADFNGDGTDDVFVASSINSSDTRHHLDLCIFRSDQSLNLNVAWFEVLGLPLSSWHHSGTVSDGQLRAEAGLFKFDPGNGWGLNRSQLAFCYVEHKPGDDLAVCPILTVNSDLNAQISNIISVGGAVDPLTLDMATGNFTGHGQDGKATAPLWDLAILIVQQFPDETTRNFQLRIVKGPLENKDQVFQTTFETLDKGVVPAITPIDGDGDSWRLGTPIHITVENLIGLDYVIQEPPKHVDYLPLKPTDPNSSWDVIDVSAASDFNVEFKDSQAVTFTTTSKDTTSWAIGGSAEVDVRQKTTIAKEQTRAEIKAKVGYDYESSEAKWNSQYSQRTTSFTSKTEKDDFIAGKIQLLDIWRYPLIGYHTGDQDNPHGVYEVIFPGPQFVFKSAGVDHSDWYQPIHQNHNLLSYPPVETEPFPADLGSFTKPDGTEVKDTMNQKVAYSFSGTAETLDISWTDEAGAGSEKSYNKTLSESLDLSIGYTGKVNFGVAKSESSFDVSLNFHNSNSWGGSTVASSTNSASKGITVNVPSGNYNQAYSFVPAVYVSSGGGQLKVAHAADPLGSSAGQSWWTQQYGGKPDPALNLPNRFVWHPPSGSNLLEYWTLNEDDNRMEMRGFFLRESTPDPVSGKYELLGLPPTDGDVVRLCARIYNFSLHRPAGPFNVKFDHVKYDDGTGTEQGGRTEIGTVVTSLNSIKEATDDNPSVKEVCVPWDTTGLSNTPYSYRFYVTLDPDDAVKNEIHEWKGADGSKLTHGNNEGHWPWGRGITVQRKQSRSGRTPETSLGPSVAMHSQSLAIKKGSVLESKGPVRVFAHQRYRLRAHIVADEDHPHYHYTVFFDGPPENGKVIALKTNFGVVDGDNYVWADWTPEETGVHEIYVHFLEDLDDRHRGDAWDVLRVIVRQKTWRDEIGDRLFHVED